jgi:hypothetical protein
MFFFFRNLLLFDRTTDSFLYYQTCLNPIEFFLAYYTSLHYASWSARRFFRSLEGNSWYGFLSRLFFLQLDRQSRGPDNRCCCSPVNGMGSSEVKATENSSTFCHRRCLSVGYSIVSKVPRI